MKIRSAGPSTKFAINLAAHVAAALALLASPGAYANPTGPSVATGSAGFAVQGSALTVTNTPGAIINWQGFSIGANEITRFIQSGSASAVLNRVTGGTSSQILGQLLSNGRVFLINPNGILVGAGATIDTAGFVASTLNLSDADFISGKMRFAGGPSNARLTNQGTIRGNGGAVYLIAPNIENSGLITSPAGEIVLAAGRSVELIDAGSPEVRVKISAPTGSDLNLSTLASGASGAFGILSNTGSVNASGVSVEGGRIVLRAEKDALLAAGSRIEATGSRGGVVQVLGERVALTGDARVDVSGMNGGGTVLVGGDFQGSNPAITNAWRTYLGRDAVIAADAIETGNGGKVILWADDATRAYGTISAKGGAQSGNGGFVEVSGKGFLDYQARVSIGATNGQGGTLLLDPTDITIVASGGTLDGQLGGTADPDILFADGGANTTLSVGSLTSGFTSGDTIRLQATNDINFNQSITLQSGVNMQAKADNDIKLNASIASSGGGTWSLTPDADLSSVGKVKFGTLSVNGPLTVSGNADFSAGTLTNNGGISITGGFDWSGGTVTGAGAFTVTGSHVLSGSIFLVNQTMTMNAASTLAAAGTLTLTNATINGAGSLTNQGTVQVTASASTINVGLANAAGGTIRLSDAGIPPSGITLTVANGFTNSGLIELVNNAGNCCGPLSATLNVTAGTLTNAVGGTIRSTGLTGVANTINAQVTNLGTMDIQQPTLINNTGRTFTSDAGTLNIAAGQKLSVSNGTASLGAGTVFAGSGTLSTAGTAVLDLASNLTLAGAGGVTLDLNGSGSTNISAAAPGTQLIVPVGGTLTLNNDTIGANVDLANSGTVAVAGGNTNAINGGLTNAAGATIRVSDLALPPSTVILTVANGFTNSGLVELVNNVGNCCGPNAATLNVTAGTLTNAAGATIRSTGPTGATNTLNAQVANQGTVEVLTPMTINNTGRTFTSDAGTLDIAASQKLSVSNGTASLGAGTVFAGSGTLFLTGTAVLDLASNLTLPGAGGVVLDLNGTGATTVSAGTPGTQLIVPVGGTLTLVNDTIGANVDLANSGTVAVAGGNTNAINGGLTNAAGATIRVSDLALPPSTVILTVANGFTNNGLVELFTNVGNCCGPNAATLNVSAGTLTNAAGATIRSTGPSVATNTLNAQVANQGTIDVQRNLTITSLASNDGTISFTANTPALNLGNGALANTATGVIQGEGTLNLGAGTLANAGTLRPGGAGAAGILNVTGNIDLTGGALEVELAGAGVYDQLLATGSVTLGGSNLKYAGIGGYQGVAADNFTNVIQAGGTLSGTILLASLTPLADFGLNPLITTGAGGSVALGVGGLNNYWTGATDLAWGTAGNWSRGHAPLAAEDAIIGLAATDPTVALTGGVQSANSLKLGSNDNLAITGGTLNLATTASIASGSTLSLLGGTLTATSVSTAAGATLSGTGTVNGAVTNAGTVAPGNSPGTLTINGNYTQAPGGTLNIELDGTTAGTGFDVLAVTGNATLDGTLAVTNTGGFLPTTANTFRFVTVGGTRTGAFATTNLPVGYTGAATYGATFADLAFSAVPVVVVPPPPPPLALPGPAVLTTPVGAADTPTATETNTRTVVASLDRVIDVIVGVPPKKAADDESGDGTVLMCK